MGGKYEKEGGCLERREGALGGLIEVRFGRDR